MAFYLAVDAGGTKTDYLLADDTRTLAVARSESIKRLRVSERAAEENLSGALALLRDRSGVDLARVAVTCIGASGAKVPLVADWLRAAFSRQVGGSLILVEDVEIAMDAAFAGGPGVLVLAGTGSNVAGRGLDGCLTTAGGWGPALADDGSGYRLGHAALRECFRALDSHRHTPLLDAIISFWELNGIADLVEKANANPTPDFAQLASIVNQCANQGDPVARRVIRQEAKALARLADIVVTRIRKRDQNPDWAPAIAFTGSIMEHVPAMREAVSTLLLKAHPSAQPAQGVASPPQGALWRARNSDTVARIC